MRDTIAAISTGMTPSGIGIVRISGSEAFEVADRMFVTGGKKKLSEQSANTVHYGFVADKGKKVDEVLAVVLRTPHSYTGEDTVEFDCHGGILSMKKILQIALSCGARLAEPGEFTKQAFLNGRIDLSQAEAVMDLISAKSEMALKNSMNQLQGKLKEDIGKIRAELLEELAFIEAALDDPEHYSLEGYTLVLAEKITAIRDKVGKLLASADQGKYIGEGINTVILGKPNVGKSSLLNLCAGKERAIVTDIPGTTRDALEEYVRFDDIALHLIDTAGIREGAGEVEKIGIRLAEEKADQADLILFVVDGSKSPDENDEEILRMIRGKKAVLVLNKIDLGMAQSAEQLGEETKLPVAAISAKYGTGIDELREMIKKMFFAGELEPGNDVIITSIRHQRLLEETAEALNNVLIGIDDEMPEDILTVDLFGAITSLDAITGENISEDLVNEIFGKFCMGK